jgi:hypothetical protein
VRVIRDDCDAGHAGADMRRERGRRRSGVEGSIEWTCRGLDHGAGQTIAIGRWPSDWAWRRDHHDQGGPSRWVNSSHEDDGGDGGDGNEGHDGDGGMTGIMDVEEDHGHGRVWGKGSYPGVWWVPLAFSMFMSQNSMGAGRADGASTPIGPCCCGFRRRGRHADSQQHSRYA